MVDGNSVHSVLFCTDQMIFRHYFCEDELLSFALVQCPKSKFTCFKWRSLIEMYRSTFFSSYDMMVDN